MAARKFFGSPDAVGRRLQETSRSYEVIGVVKDLAEPFSDSGDESEITNVVPTVYLPLTRSEFGRAPSGGMTILVRTGRAADTMEGVRRKIAGMDANVVIFNVRTLTQQVDRGTFLIRLITIFYGSVGVFGLILAAIGLAGVTAYSVARRRKEIGIRVAIGASQGQVLRLVMREGGALVLVGSVLGFLGAVVVSRGLGAISTAFGQSFAAGSHDLRLIVGAPLLLAGLAMLACYVPARRSMRIDPLDALRDE
jgi:ABC-type antimicrobial peptide transport system permease subunit